MADTPDAPQDATPPSKPAINAGSSSESQPSTPTASQAQQAQSAAGIPSFRRLPSAALPATGSMVPTIIQLPPKRTMGPWLLGVGIALAVLLVVYFLRAAIALAIGAYAVAYVCAPAVARLKKLRIPKSVAIGTVLLGGTTTLFGSFALLIPELIRQLQTVIQSLPRYQQHVQQVWLPYLRHTLHLNLPARTDQALGQLGLRLNNLGGALPDVANTGLNAGVFLIEALFTTLIVLALAFYISVDFDSIRERAFDLVPHRARPRVGSLLKEIDETLRHFVSGQLLVMGVLSVLYSVGLGALGVPAGWAIGLFSGLISFVPYLGFFIALGLALVMTALSGQGGGHLLAVTGVMGAVHVLDLMLITPRIVGNRTRLAPAVVILAMVAGGALAGIVGVFFAIPAASVVGVLVRHVIDLYKRSNFFLDGGDVAIASVPITGVPSDMFSDLAAEFEPSPLAYKPPPEPPSSPPSE
ncbi:MAG: AI-2E family transporter [Polyangiales bacterium]